MARVNRSWVRRVEHASSEEMISIPQADGTVKRFPQSQLKAAYLSAISHALGRDEPEHPVLTAMRNSPDPRWRELWADLLDNDADEPDDLAE